MKINGKPFQAIWHEGEDPAKVMIIDQRLLPHKLELVELDTVDRVIEAIVDMYVRGAPLIGATGAYGVYVALKNCPGEEGLAGYLEAELDRIAQARPTAVNLAWAVEKAGREIGKVQGLDAKRRASLEIAAKIADTEVENCRNIGRHGLPLIREIYEKTGKTVHVLTHCNAGWLACVDVGTATAPIYAAHDAGIPVHVWVDETRPLNQGSRLTAWELLQHGVPHTVIVDNAGGHLMQHGQVDLCIVGTDRTTHTGDVANKIGTYLKALAARDNQIPFYVALPSSTIDWEETDGSRIPIEDRDPDEVRLIYGALEQGTGQVLVPPKDSPAKNPAFDVTPARLVTALITERGVCPASKDGIKGLFGDAG